MFLTINRFKVRPGREAAFEALWLGRQSQLATVPGFLGFHLLRGPERGDHRLYASHSSWESEASFGAWTRSEAFRAAHRDAAPSGELYLDRPELETFESLQEVVPSRD